ncbi:MAG: hypothetical protein WCO93_07750 [bacterium]
MKPKIIVIHWIPRILCILAILFISVFALDSFDPRLTIWQQIGGFLIHLIPTYVLILFLYVAWKWELIGGIILAILGAAFTPIIYMMNYNMNHSVWITLSIVAMITLPFIIIGGLFILSHFMKMKEKTETNTVIQ